MIAELHSGDVEKEIGEILVSRSVLGGLVSVFYFKVMLGCSLVVIH